jgi:hypothetical protein
VHNKHVPALKAPAVVQLDLPKAGDGKALADDGRVIVVGDTHGCLAEFNDLMADLGVRPDADRVVIIGDIVNIGPHSAELLRHVMAQPHIVAIRGNHEDGALVAAAQSAAGEAPEAQIEWVQTLAQAAVEYMRDLPRMMRLPDFDVILVHAGLLPGVALEEQPHVITSKLRILVAHPETRDDSKVEDWLPFESNWKDRKAHLEHTNFKPWWHLWRAEHIVFGHDARKGLQMGPHATGLDTGCCTNDANARLTAMVLGPHLPDRATIERRRRDGCAPTEYDRPGMLVSVPSRSRRARWGSLA